MAARGVGQWRRATISSLVAAYSLLAAWPQVAQGSGNFGHIFFTCSMAASGSGEWQRGPRFFTCNMAASGLGQWRHMQPHISGRGAIQRRHQSSHYGNIFVSSMPGFGHLHAPVVLTTRLLPRFPLSQCQRHLACRSHVCASAIVNMPLSSVRQLFSLTVELLLE